MMWFTCSAISLNVDQKLILLAVSRPVLNQWQDQKLILVNSNTRRTTTMRHLTTNVMFSETTGCPLTRISDTLFVGNWFCVEF